MDPNHSNNDIDRAGGPALAFIAGGKMETVNLVDLDFGIGLDSPEDTCRTDKTDYSSSNFRDFISSDVNCVVSASEEGRTKVPGCFVSARGTQRIGNSVAKNNLVETIRHFKASTGTSIQLSGGNRI